MERLVNGVLRVRRTSYLFVAPRNATLTPSFMLPCGAQDEAAPYSTSHRQHAEAAARRGVRRRRGGDDPPRAASSSRSNSSPFLVAECQRAESDEFSVAEALNFMGDAMQRADHGAAAKPCSDSPRRGFARSNVFRKPVCRFVGTAWSITAVVPLRPWPSAR